MPDTYIQSGVDEGGRVSDTTTAVIDAEGLDISLGDVAVSERRFIGEVVIDLLENGKFGPQWHLGVKPISFALRSESGAFHDWPAIKYSTKDGSLVKTGEFGRVSNELRTVHEADLKAKYGQPRKDAAIADAKARGMDTTELQKVDPMSFVKVGKGDFLGLVGEFALRVLEYGKDKKEKLENGEPNPNFGKAIKGGRESLIATRTVTAQEIADANAAREGVASPAAPAYSAYDVNALLDLMDGKSRAEYTRGIGRNQSLSQELRNAVSSGAAAAYLTSNGLAVQDGDTLRRAG